MTCNRIKNGFIRTSPSFRLRLLDGSYVFMSWHSYCGPEFYMDRLETRPIRNWWDNELIIKAIDWFQSRGNKA